MFDVHVVVAGILQVDGGVLRQLANALDGVDLTGNFSKDGGGVAGPGTNFEHSFAAFQHQGLDHEGHDEGLGYVLTTANRERSIVVGMLAKLAWNEDFAWHFSDGFQHPAVADASCDDVSRDHVPAHQTADSCHIGLPRDVSGRAQEHRGLYELLEASHTP